MDKRPYFIYGVSKKEYDMGREEIMEDAIRELTELAVQERRETSDESE